MRSLPISNNESSRALVLCVLFSTFLLCHANHPVERKDPSPRRFTQNKRNLAEQKCVLCAYSGSSVRSNFVPFEVPSKQTIEDSFNSSDVDVPSLATNLSCADWSDLVAKMSHDDSASCIDLQDLLTPQCCDGMPPLYECQTMVNKALFTEDYNRNIVPIASGKMLDVSMLIHISNIGIADHGYEGGALEIRGSITSHWIDERLKWNSSEAGCSSIDVKSDQIWLPTLSPDNEDSSSDYVNIVGINTLADGRISSTQEFRMRAGCKTVRESAAKMCSLKFHGFNHGKVNYVTNHGIEGKGIILDDIYALQEYKLDFKRSNVTVHPSDTRGDLVHDVNVNLDFESLDNDCNICGDVDANLYDGIINDLDEDWVRFFPDTEGLSCTELNLLLTPYPVSSEECSVGRANFEEACCDDKRSSFVCENSIYDNFVEKYNTVTPPDPHTKEGNQSLISKDVIDVGVSIDVMHVVGIDVKSNSLQMLVALELNWFDSRLVWEPFIGGCHRVSYRASLDVEQTDIWVPNIELVNQLEGVQNLPDAFASVWYDGHARWRRTGILEGVCDLSGIASFPFDTVGCSLEFGGTRDPYFHRVGYHLERIEYSERVSDEKWNYQQYKLNIPRTENKTRSEVLSGFENVLVSVHFYFDRAQHFYVHMFVVLYVLFTYLSFGTFFIDYKLGERLGYGASILFVIVAQDITMADATPVTQEFLWIYKLSLGSKVFVIFALVQSVIVLWIYTNGDWREEMQQREMTLISPEETQDLIKRNDDSSTPVIQEHRQSSFEDDTLRKTQVTEGKPSGSTVDNGSGDFQEGRNSTDRSRASSNVKILTAILKKYISMGNIFLRYSIHDDDSERIKKIKRLKMADVASAVTCFVSYSIFVMVMFLTV